RTAFEVDLPGANRRDAGLGCHLFIFDGDLDPFELVRDLRDHLVTEVDRIADRVTGPVEVGEWDRALAVPEGHHFVVFDLFRLPVSSCANAPGSPTSSNGAINAPVSKKCGIKPPAPPPASRSSPRSRLPSAR